MDYAFEHEGTAFTPNQTQGITDVATHNAELEKAELAQWSERPERWTVYIVRRELPSPKADAWYTARNGGKPCVAYQYAATTWLGTRLSEGRVAVSTFHNNLTGTKVTSVRFTGTNGATYYGRYGSDWAQCCNVRKAKRAA